ncbi:MAG: response regulator [Saprospiraceae bacterium]|nr:response regulator [Saprospiraceae bacterium]MCB9286490.1 response regulator [Lewinellaceae bacterium]
MALLQSHNWIIFRLLSSLLLFNVLAVSSSAQEYLVSVQNYSVPQGLSNRHIAYVEQDRQGLIWVATLFGLNRFDGYDFQQFTAEANGFRSNNFGPISEDRNGRLWLLGKMSTSNQKRIIDIFDPATQTVVPFEKAFQVPFDIPKVKYMWSDLYHNIFMLLSDGQVYRFDGEVLRHILDYPISKLTYFAVSQEGVIGILDSNKVIQYDSLGKYLSQTTLSNTAQYIYGEVGGFLVEHRVPGGASSFWFIHNEDAPQLFHFRNAQGKPVSLIQPFDNESLQAQDRNACWWAFTKDGLQVFDAEGNFLYDLSPHLKGFQIQNPLHISFDDRNVAWIGTNTGLYSIAITKKLFTNYLPAEELTDTRGIVQDQNGKLYVVQKGEVWQVTKSGKTIGQNISGCLAAVRDAKGALWFGDYNSRVYYFNPDSEEKKIFYPVSGKQAIGSVRALGTDAKTSRIWVGIENKGLAYIDQKKQAIVPFTAYHEFQSLQKGTINYFLQDELGIWLCTTKGLYLLRPEVGIVAEYSRQMHDLPFDDIYHLYKDKQGIFWLATCGGGLIRWDKNKKTYRQFTKKDGLSNDVIYAVYEDEFNQLWLPSNYGLMCFDKSTFQAQAYLPRDGIPHEEFNFTSHYQATDGRLFFGGLKGVAAFYPKDFYLNEKSLAEQTQLSVSQYLELSGTTGAFEDKTLQLDIKEGIRLRPNNKSFLLKIAFSDYQSPKDNRFAYHIDGLNTLWNYQTSNAIQINNLPYGTYTLRIKAQGANGHWTSQELQLPLVVVRPFYLRWWFIFIGIGGIVAFVWWRIRTIQQAAVKLETEVVKRTEQIEQKKQVIEKQAAELRQLDELKSRFFANMAHELRTPITLILMPLKKLLKEANLDNRSFSTLKVIESNAKELMRLSEEILDLDKLEARRLKLQEEAVDFYPFIRRLVSNFEYHARSIGIELQLYYRPEPYLRLKLDHKKLERILFNLLSNAIKFTDRGGTVRVTITSTANHIKMTVNDTGRGIHSDDLPHIFDRFYQAKHLGNRAEGGVGIGLTLAMEYAQLMNGSLSVESHLDEGSTFTLTLPKQEVFGVPATSEAEITETSTVQQSLTATKKGQQKGLVIIVEDNSDMRRFIQEVFTPNYDVLSAENGALAIDLLESLPQQAVPELIVTDLMMPKMDGYQLLEILKADARWQGIPVIVLTAKASLSDRVTALRIGVDDYLSKPFETEELLVRAENLIQNYYNRRSLLQKQADRNTFSNIKELTTLEESISADQQWLETVEQITLQRISESAFSVHELAESLNLSERQLLRKLKQLTGVTTSGYLREIRLQKARRLLENKTYATVAETCYAVGLSDLKHFTELFRKRFGNNPVEFLHTS